MITNGPDNTGQETRQCPDCGSETGEKYAIFGWWMCDDCEIAFNDNGEVTAR